MGLGNYISKKIQQAKENRAEHQRRMATINKSTKEAYYESREAGAVVKAKRRGFNDGRSDFGSKTRGVANAIKDSGNFLVGDFNFSAGVSKPQAKITRVKAGNKTITIRESAPRPRNSERDFFGGPALGYVYAGSVSGKRRSREFDPWKDVPGW